jgi:hypothetical protein
LNTKQNHDKSADMDDIPNEIDKNRTKLNKLNKIDERANGVALLPPTTGSGLVLCWCTTGRQPPLPCIRSLELSSMKGIGESDAGLLSLAREIRRGARSGHPAWRGGVGGRVQRCVPRAMEGDRGINACQ